MDNGFISNNNGFATKDELARLLLLINELNSELNNGYESFSLLKYDDEKVGLRLKNKYEADVIKNVQGDYLPFVPSSDSVSIGTLKFPWKEIYAGKFYDASGYEIGGKPILQRNEFGVTTGKIIDISIKKNSLFNLPFVEVLKFSKGGSSNLNSNYVLVDNINYEFDINAIEASTDGKFGMIGDVALTFTSGDTIGDFVENTSEVFDVTGYADVIGMEYEER